MHLVNVKEFVFNWICVFYLLKQLGSTIWPPRTRAMRRLCEGDSRRMTRNEMEAIPVVRRVLAEVRAAHLGPLQVKQSALFTF